MGHLRIERLTGPPGRLTDAAGRVIVARCHRADGVISRAVGLLGTPDLGRDESLWLAPCAGIHTAGMRIAIGCAFLDGAGRVLRVIDPLPPWRAVRVAGARSVVECAPGVLAHVRIGDRLRLEAVDSPQ